jgi:hypothetical protein
MKIFGIGRTKTGTTTLKMCFRILGYSHKGYDRDLFGDLEKALLVARRYDTFQDLPWYVYYEELDRRFPGSKFVLTVRDSKRWVRSYRNALSRQGPPSQRRNEMRRKLYGLPFPDVTDDQLMERVEQHTSDVERYFADRPEDLLVVDWEKGDGWEQLCAFLDRPVPSQPFPHANKGVYS